MDIRVILRILRITSCYLVIMILLLGYSDGINNSSPPNEPVDLPDLVDSIIRATSYENNSIKVELLEVPTVFENITKIVISYRLMMEIFTIDPDTTIDRCTANIVTFEQRHAKNLRDRCIEDLSGYGVELAKEQDLKLTSHCYSRSVFFSPKDTNHILLKDLLPGQRYELKISIINPIPGKNSTTRNTELKLSPITVCTNDEGRPPRYHPQADLSSFHVANLIDGLVRGDSMLVDLYWQPLPLALIDSKNYSNIVQCYNTNHNLVVDIALPISNSQLRISKPINVTWLCGVYTRNLIGISDNCSLIVAPSKTNLIIPNSNFKFYVVELEDHRVIARWNPINSQNIIDSSNNSAQELEDGYYAIHVCHKISKSTCSRVNRIKTTKYVPKLEIPDLFVTDDMRFGISYRTLKRVEYTGITWLNCMSRPKSTLALFQQPLSITKNTVPFDNQSVTIEWEYADCESQKAMIDYFEVEYCFIEESIGCLGMMLQGSETVTSHQGPAYESNSKYCTLKKQSNNLSNQMKINNLNPSTKYAMRVRFYLEDGNSSLWSDPFYVKLPMQPSDLSWCNTKWIGGPIIVTILMAIICTLKIQVCLIKFDDLRSRYSTTKHRFPKHVEDLNRCDSSSEMGLKYWINRFPNQNEAISTNSESSSSVRDQEKTNLSADAHEADHDNSAQVLDYLPRSLLDAQQQDRTIAESVSEDNQKFFQTSDLDDVSITSHSSFLNTILNTEANLTNNNTTDATNNDLLPTARAIIEANDTDDEQKK